MLADGQPRTDADMEFTRVFTLRQGNIIGLEIYWTTQKPSKPWDSVSAA